MRLENFWTLSFCDQYLFFITEIHFKVEGFLIVDHHLERKLLIFNALENEETNFNENIWIVKFCSLVDTVLHLKSNC